MTMKYIISLLLICGILLTLTIDNSYGMYGQASIAAEEFLFENIETIVSASKREQRIQDSPAAISVITEEDIKESGALSIPDILRYIPGIDVMEITSSHWEINARGLNQILSNKMLVMIDGRSVYLDYFGGVIWQGLPIVMKDISRIEVIRSPISALYGANAFSGIINIITKSPRESAGTYVSFDGGNLNSLRSTIIHGGRKGKFGYKISGNARRTNSWNASSINRRSNGDFSEERGIANVKLDYLISGKSSLSFDSGFETGDIEQIVLSSILPFDGSTSYAKLNYNWSDMKMQLFWNHGSISSPSFVDLGEETNFKFNTFDLEIVETLDLSSTRTITYGGSARIKTIQSDIIDKDHNQDLYAGFIQNEYKPNNKVSTILSLRIDNHPLVKINYSPRASVIVEPWTNHTIRLTASKAFRNPSFIDSYTELFLAPIPLPSPPFPAGTQTTVSIIGNEDLKPENIETYELGYQTFIKRKMKMKVDLFYNRIDDFIGRGAFESLSFFSDPDTGELLIDPSTNLPIPESVSQSFVNVGSAEALGGEIDMDWLINNWFRIRANYSYIDMKNRYTLNQFQMPSKNRFNVVTDFSFTNNVSLNILGHYVDKARWDIPRDDNSGAEKRVTNSYFTTDTRLAYALPEYNIETNLIMHNIFNDVHKEYPVGENIGRRISFRVSVKL